MLKRIRAEYPYDDYWLYVVWHKKEGRWQANLVKISDTSERTTLSFARYVMSVKLGRLLDTATEHVDHINNNKSDDRIENLQILSPEENKKKQQDYYKSLNPDKMEINCSFCGDVFKILIKNHRYHTKQGRTKFNCSRKCAANSLRKSPT